MQWYLLASVFTATLTMAGLLFRYRSELDFSISLNASKHPMALLWLAVGGGLSLAFACIWYFGWLVENHNASMLSSVTFTLIITGFLIAIVIPDTEGCKRTIHRVGAYMSVVAAPIFLMTLLDVVRLELQPIAVVCIAAQIAMIYLLFFVREALKYLLQFQALYFVSFFIVLLIMTYA